MAASIYEDAHFLACCNAQTALGNRIGLYKANGATRVGTVYTDTTWGGAAKINDGGTVYARSTGSTVTIVVPAGTCSNGDVISHYGVFNGSTLLRRKDLPFSIVVNDATQAVNIDVQPIHQITVT